MLTAITRAVSPTIEQCELSFLERQPIDLRLAQEQHRLYEAALEELGVSVISLPAEPEWPDAVFVEDPAIVLDEVAILTRPGAVSRRPEAASLAKVLERYRPLRWIEEPGTLEGGDVMRAERTLFVGTSARSNAAGIEQLAALLNPFGYDVKAAGVRGCLHLKSACTYLGAGRVLVNREWADCAALADYELVDVAPGEPEAANVLVIGDSAMVAGCFPATARILERLGLRVKLLDNSELMKAEAGMTCSSLIFRS